MSKDYSKYADYQLSVGALNRNSIILSADIVSSLVNDCYVVASYSELPTPSDCVPGDVAVVTSMIGENTSTVERELFYCAGNEWQPISGHHKSDNVYFDSNLSIVGDWISVDGILNGNVIQSKGKPLDWLLSSLPTFIDKNTSKVTIDSDPTVVDLSIYKVTNDEFADRVLDDDHPISSNEMFIIEDDYIDCYGQDIRNVLSSTEPMNAATVGQVGAAKAELCAYANQISADCEIISGPSGKVSDPWTCAPTATEWGTQFSVKWTVDRSEGEGWALFTGDTKQGKVLGDENSRELSWSRGAGTAFYDVTAVRQYSGTEYYLSGQPDKKLQPAGDYASGRQGVKADTAVQPEDLPEKLPNPEALKFVLSSVNGYDGYYYDEYDGLSGKTISSATGAGFGLVRLTDSIDWDRNAISGAFAATPLAVKTVNDKMRSKTDICIYANSAQEDSDYIWTIPGTKGESNIWSAGTYKYFGGVWRREDDPSNERCIRRKPDTEKTFQLVQNFTSENPIIMAEFDEFGPHEDVQIESSGFSAKVDISGAVDYIATVSQLDDKLDKVDVIDPLTAEQSDIGKAADARATHDALELKQTKLYTQDPPSWDFSLVQQEVEYIEDFLAEASNYTVIETRLSETNWKYSVEGYRSEQYYVADSYRTSQQTDGVQFIVYDTMQTTMYGIVLAKYSERPKIDIPTQVDVMPTANSGKLITSGGVHSALADVVKYVVDKAGNKTAVTIGSRAAGDVGKRSLSVGKDNVANGNDSAAIGERNTSSGAQSLTVGEDCSTVGQDSIAAGQWSVANETGSFALGRSAVANNNGEIAVGVANVSHNVDDDDNNIHIHTAFSVGVGIHNGPVRKNGFEILKDGKVYVLGIGGYEGTQDGTMGDHLADVVTWTNQTANQAATRVGLILKDFSETSVYEEGDIVQLNNQIYRCLSSGTRCDESSITDYFENISGTGLATDTNRLIMSKLSVDNTPANVNMVHISQDDYEQLVIDGDALSNTLYILSGNDINAYGQQIKNIAPGNELSDAVNVEQLNAVDSKTQCLNAISSNSVLSDFYNTVVLSGTNAVTIETMCSALFELVKTLGY